MPTVSGISLTLDEVHAFAARYHAVPIFRTIPRDGLSPLDVFRAIHRRDRSCFILDSALTNGDHGRYTFIAFDPQTEYTCTHGEMTIRDPRDGTARTFHTNDPGAELSAVLAQNSTPRLLGVPPFSGGLVGYFAYDYIEYAEPSLRVPSADDEGFKDVDLMLFTTVIAFDQVADLIYLIATVPADADDHAYAAACAQIDALEDVVRNPHPDPDAAPPLRLTSAPRMMFDEAAYCDIVERAKAHIDAGDVFQVVPSNRIAVDAQGSLFDTYCHLRHSNPSPYMFYFSSPHIEIAGASPETLVQVRAGVVTTVPLAGTRPRGKTPDEDAELEAELRADPKELAEHNMLVDLGRNDLGKICEFGSVEVTDYQDVVRYSHVMHLASRVRGRVRDDVSPLDAVGAVLPAGTLSGAPKVEACRIIGELEGSRRGLYGGAIGYLGLTGDLDTCIAIRLAFAKDGVVYVRAGAGIVADSVPANEYRECLAKMGAVLDAIEATSAPSPTAMGDDPDAPARRSPRPEPTVADAATPSTRRAAR